MGIPNSLFDVSKTKAGVWVNTNGRTTGNKMHCYEQSPLPLDIKLYLAIDRYKVSLNLYWHERALNHVRHARHHRCRSRVDAFYSGPSH